MNVKFSWTNDIKYKNNTPFLHLSLHNYMAVFVWFFFFMFCFVFTKSWIHVVGVASEVSWVGWDGMGLGGVWWRVRNVTAFHYFITNREQNWSYRVSCFLLLFPPPFFSQSTHFKIILWRQQLSLTACVETVKCRPVHQFTSIVNIKYLYLWGYLGLHVEFRLRHYWVDMRDCAEWIHFQGKQLYQNCFASLLKRGLL